MKYGNSDFVRKFLGLENLLLTKCFIKNHNYNTRATINYQLDLPPTQTVYFGTYSLRKKVAEPWNEIQRMSIPGLLKRP